MMSMTTYPITAALYSNGSEFETSLHQYVEAMIARGRRLAGLIQHSQPNPDRPKCDMYLRDLSTGQLYPISEDRGPHARGCMLNVDKLLQACAAAEAGVSRETDLLVLCKFGKAEAEGGGVRALIAKAIELSVPVLIGVPIVNLAPFRDFAGGLAREISRLADVPIDVARQSIGRRSWL
jgi:hypothetical protein